MDKSTAFDPAGARWLKVMLFAVAAVMLLAVASPSRAQPAALTGFWLHGANQRCNPVCRNGAVVETPQFTGWAKEKIAAQKTEDAKRPVDAAGIADTYCLPNHPPGPMRTSAPIDILITPKVAAIVAEDRAIARTIYLDGRAHPDMEAYDKTINGHSTGHWEGPILVVDTVGMSYELPDQDFANGAPVTETFHMLERFRVYDGGKMLEITTRFDDPKVYTKPFTERRIYERLDGEAATAMEYYCDPRDARRGSSAPPEGMMEKSSN